MSVTAETDALAAELQALRSKQEPTAYERDCLHCIVALVAERDQLRERVRALEADAAPRFANVSCSHCGRSFGPGNHGFSHCDNHKGLSPKEIVR